MRIYSWIGPVVMLAAVAMPAIAGAQKFQELTKEELQMTWDPKAPGAPAVYLYLEETADPRSHRVSTYARIKILTEEGKKLATVEIPNIPGISAAPLIEIRIVHPDGTVLPLHGKPQDILIPGRSTSDARISAFNVPGLEVGSVLEYRWAIPLDNPVSAKVNQVYRGLDTDPVSSAWDWRVQRDLFIHKAHFSYNTETAYFVNQFGPVEEIFDDSHQGTNYLYAQHLPPGAQITKFSLNDYFLNIEDVPAFNLEQNSPPESAVRYVVHFYCSPFTPKEFWEKEARLWSQQLDQSAIPGPALAGFIAQTISGASTDEAKARKLYDAVQDMENTDFSQTKPGAERRSDQAKAKTRKVEDVLKEKRGTGNELAMLFLAMVRGAGLKADAVKVADRREKVFDRNYFSLDQLDDLLVVLHLDGKDIYIDPGQKLCPFGQLHWAHTLTGGIQQGVPEPVYIPANLTKDAITAHAADLVVDPAGNVSGTVQLVMNGPAALRWRQLNLTASSEEVKRQVTESLHRILPAGMNAEIVAMKGLETPEGFFQVTAKVSGALGSVTGKRVLLPAFLFSASGEKQFVTEEKREFPVDLHYAEQVIDDVVYHLPAGYAVESAPQAAQLPWPDHATLVVKVTANGSTLDVRHTFARAFVLLDAKEYPSLHDYYAKLAANDQGQVVLKAN